MKEMHKRKATARRLAQISALAIIGLGLTGCMSRGYDKGDAAALSMQYAAADVQAESQALETTLTALSDLVTRPAGDLKPQFEQYSGSLDWLVRTSKRAAQSTRRMEQKHAAYMATWGKELDNISYESVRSRGEARKTEVAARFEAVDQRSHETQQAVGPLINYLEDIRTALSTDLTPEGLASVKTIVDNASENTAKVRTALARLSSEFENASGRMSTVTTQPAATGTTSVR